MKTYFIHTPPNASLWQRVVTGSGLSGADGTRLFIYVPISSSPEGVTSPRERGGAGGRCLCKEGQLSSSLALLDPGEPEQSPARAGNSTLSAEAPAQPLPCCLLGLSILFGLLRHPSLHTPNTPHGSCGAASLLLPLDVKCCLCHLGILTRTTQLIQQLLISAGTGAGTEGGTGHLHGLGSLKTWDEVKVGRGWLKALSTIMFNSLRTIS